MGREYRRLELAGHREIRAFAADGLQLRSAATNGVIEISGRPIVYNSAYSVRDSLGEFSETMKPGVVAELLKDKNLDCRFLFNHDGLPLARTTAGTMSLKDGPSALSFTAKLDARQQLSNDLAVAIERGDVTQMSCGFVVAEDEWPDNETRIIRSLRSLLDVSAVTYPASPTTSISLGELRSGNDVSKRILLRSELAHIKARRNTTDALARELRRIKEGKATR